MIISRVTHGREVGSRARLRESLHVAFPSAHHTKRLGWLMCYNSGQSTHIGSCFVLLFLTVNLYPDSSEALSILTSLGTEQQSAEGGVPSVRAARDAVWKHRPV